MSRLLQALALPVLFWLSILAPLEAQEAWRSSPELLAEAERIVEPDFIASWGPQETWTQHQVDVMRAGLRFPAGPICRKAALTLDDSWLDFEEQGRVVDLLIAEACRNSDGGLVDFEDFRFCLGADDIPRLFSEIEREPKSDKSFYLGKIHVIMRTEHASLAAPLLGTNDPRLRLMVEEALYGSWGYDNSNPEVIALALTRYLALPVESDDNVGGLDPRLVALLRHFMLGGSTSSKAPRFEFHHGLLINWLWRWLGDSHPRAQDMPILRRLDQGVPLDRKLIWSSYLKQFFTVSLD